MVFLNRKDRANCLVFRANEYKYARLEGDYYMSVDSLLNELKGDFL